MTFTKILYTIGLSLLISTSVSAQTAAEAFRYSSTFQIGTARNIGVGGVMGGLGADFSVLSTNPAGIARYKSTEFGVSPNIAFGKTTGDYLGNQLEDNHVQFNLSSAGFVFAKRRRNTEGWKSISGGVGINRLDDYNDKIFLSGTNNNSSLLDMHSALANGTHPDDLPTDFPFDVGLTALGQLISADTNLNYSPVMGNIAPGQSVTVAKEGGKYEMAVGAGGNYNDVLYIGGSIGIPIIRYEETVIIYEEDADNVVPQFNYFDFASQLRTLGYGVNFKAGVLAKPHKLVRLGVSFHTPTYLRLEDDYLATLYSDFDTVAYNWESPNGEFDYNLVTPWKFLVNAAVLLDEYGFLGLEYELQNPGKAKYKFKADAPGIKDEENARNDQISNAYTWQHSVKAGVEIKLDPVRLRAGVQYKTSGSVDDTDGQMIYSGGIGYRGKHVFVDGAYSYASDMGSYTPYELGSITSGTAALNRNRSQVTFTVGAKF